MKEIFLSGKIGSGMRMIVDDIDYDVLFKYKWHAFRGAYKVGGNLYAASKIKGRYVLAHRLIFGEPDGKHIDHINGNGLDNRRENLRVCTPSENHRNTRVSRKNNTTGYKGVSFEKQTGRYRAHINPIAGGRTKHLGRFDTPREAAECYNEMAKKLFGDFAQLNEF